MAAVTKVVEGAEAAERRLAARRLAEAVRAAIRFEPLAAPAFESLDDDEADAHEASCFQSSAGDADDLDQRLARALPRQRRAEVRRRCDSRSARSARGRAPRGRAARGHAARPANARRPAPSGRWRSLAAALLRREERGLGPRRQRLLRALAAGERRQREGAPALLHALGRRSREKVCFAGEVAEEQMAATAGIVRTRPWLPSCRGLAPEATEPERCFATRALPLASPGPWAKLTEALLHRHGRLAELARPSHTAGPRKQPSLWQQRAWAHLREVSAAAWRSDTGAREQGALTLRGGELSLELMKAKGAARLQERRWRRKWAHWLKSRLLNAVFRAWAATRPPRPVDCYDFAVADDGFPPAVSAGAPAPGSAEEAALAAELGMDVATYRMLRLLEERDIVPEDYDVLLRLDESVAPKTLAPAQLRRFPTEVYARASEEPVEPEGADEEQEEQAAEEVCFGVGFWRLPCGRRRRSAGAPKSPSSDAQSGGQVEPDQAELCPICFAPFEAGQSVRRLQPCGHLFHKPCIDGWLLESSTRCPVDNLEVS